MMRGSIGARCLRSLLGLAFGAALAFSTSAFDAPARGVQEQDPVRFITLDLELDPGRGHLAAWQVELREPAGRARIVGVEGGAHPAFSAPPHYDPAALQGGRIRLAAFDPDGPWPAGRTRVASLHLAVQGAGPPAFEIEVMVAADGGGAALPAQAYLLPR